MPIKKNQIEAKPDVLPPSVTKPDTLGSKGSFYTKEVGGVVEGFYVDSNGIEIQITQNGSILGGGGSGGSGEINTASNLGIGHGQIFGNKVGADLRFKTLMAGSNVSLNSDDDAITISSLGGSGGSTNEFVFTLPAASDLQGRIDVSTDIPSGWSLAPATTAGEPQFAMYDGETNAQLLVITWDPTLGAKIAQEISCYTITTSGPDAIQGIIKQNHTVENRQKTNTSMTRAMIDLSIGDGLDASKEYKVFIKLI